jgi:hypothetical protein
MNTDEHGFLCPPGILQEMFEQDYENKDDYGLFGTFDLVYSFP